MSDEVKQGRPREERHKDINEMSMEGLKARVAYLEVENDFLKKTESLGTMCKYRRFALVSKAHQQGLSVKSLCLAANVSISGYYKCCKNHRYKEQKDISDLRLIQEIFEKKHKKAGIRTIYMKLQQKYGITMNLKKIARIKK